MGFMAKEIKRRFNARKEELGREITEADVLEFIHQHFSEDVTVEDIQKVIPKFEGGSHVVTAEMYAEGLPKVIAHCVGPSKQWLTSFLKLAEERLEKGGKVTEKDVLKTIHAHNPKVTLEDVQKAFPGFEGGDREITQEMLEHGIKRLIDLHHEHQQHPEHHEQKEHHAEQEHHEAKEHHDH